MKNKLPDLRNHLFEMLERLGDEEITPENLRKEKARAKAIVDVSKQIIESAKVEVQFIKATGIKSVTDFVMPLDDLKQLEASRSKGKDVGLTALK